MGTSIAELQTMTESEKMYRIYERMEEMYASNDDWKHVLESKWGMASWGQKGGN